MEAQNCPLTDGGIKGLCSNIDSIKSIETLDIVGTNKITTNGIRMALESLPSLKVFCCNFPTQLLGQLIGLPLGRLCSAVSKIWLSSKISDQELLELLKLKELCELNIHSFGDFGNLTFNGGFLPLLKHFGIPRSLTSSPLSSTTRPLTSLSIANLYQCPINIRAIVDYCPKLESLSLVNIKTISTEKSEDEQNPLKLMKTDPFLKNLKTLKLTLCRDLTSEDLNLLLASPALEELSLEEIDAANDTAFQKAENIHQFRNLERLTLFCRNVTKVVIDLLMNDENPLNKIQICRCHSLSRDDICKWERTVREKRWNCVFLSCNHSRRIKQTARKSTGEPAPRRVRRR